MEKYFNAYYEPSLRGFTALDRKILDIRDHIGGLLYGSKFQAVDAMLRGILYTDKGFCVSVITWKSKWEQDQGTLLHEILTKSKTDPPTTLIQMVLDIAPHVLYIEDVADFLPIDFAICIHGLDHMTRRSMDIIKVLIQADTTRRTLKDGIHRVVTQAVWRGDVDVLEYLLTFEECRNQLLQPQYPIYYSSRDHIGDGTIAPFLQALLRATAQQLRGRSYPTGCLYECIEASADYVHDYEALLRIALQHSQFHCASCKANNSLT
jgi:hypothetical protein